MRVLRVGAPAAVLLGLLVALAGAAADPVSSIAERAEGFADAFDIRYRPGQLDESWIVGFLAELPSFGEQTIEALLENEPYTSLSELAALVRPSGRRVLSDKQLLLIAIFFDLEP